jgi:dihydrodipicolinate synthase/N-acetylneuraminate lyase
MGEFIRLSYEERRNVVRIVSEEANGRPILAGAAEANIELVLEMCNYCADLGCRAVSITGPYYYKLTQESIEAYFRERAAKSPIDIVVYNIPVFANEISLPVLERLAMDCQRIVGTKDPSKDMGRFQQTLHTIKRQRPDFSVLIGWEELLCTGLFMGADGGTLSSAGVVPEVVMSLYHAARAGSWDRAKQIQFELLDLFSLMVGAPNFPEGFRTGYQLRGFKAGTPDSRFHPPNKDSSPRCAPSSPACSQVADFQKRQASAGFPPCKIRNHPWMSMPSSKRCLITSKPPKPVNSPCKLSRIHRSAVSKYLRHARAGGGHCGGCPHPWLRKHRQ